MSSTPNQQSSVDSENELWVPREKLSAEAGFQSYIIKIINNFKREMCQRTEVIIKTKSSLKKI